jgi:hypothetical protein
MDTSNAMFICVIIILVGVVFIVIDEFRGESLLNTIILLAR